MLQDHEDGAIASCGKPLYAPAFTGTLVILGGGGIKHSHYIYVLALCCRVLDLRLTGHGFKSQPVRFHVT